MEHKPTDTEPELLTPIQPIATPSSASRGKAAAGKPSFSPAYTPGHFATSKPHKSPRVGGAKVALAVVAGIVIIGYITGVVAFSRLYYPGTTLAGQDISLLDVQTAADRVSQSIGQYKLAVEGENFSWTYKPEDGTYKVNVLEAATSLKDQENPFGWPINLYKSITGHAPAVGKITASFDKDVFSQQLGQAIDAYNKNRSGIFDVASAFDTQSNTFTVQQVRSNQKMNRDAVVKAALSAAEHIQTQLDLDASYMDTIAGGATDEQISAACDAANAIYKMNLKFTYAGKDVASLDGATLKDWMVFGEDLTPSLDTSKLSAWASELATSSLDTVGTSRTYTRPNGKQITVSGGTFGWVSDEAALKEKIQSAVASHTSQTIEIPTKQKGDVYTGLGQPDWGAYVDIDLTEQHAYYYDATGNLLWESGVITGNPNLGNETPTGIYYLRSNNGAASLVGKTDPATGKPEYITPVDYWMPFIGGAIGLHDASWQKDSSFSDPTAYLRVGSHGCVNLPPTKAQELHNMIKVNTCVIVHN